MPPQYYMTGGFDFRKAQDVEDLKEWLVGQIIIVVKEFLEKEGKAYIVWQGVTLKERIAYLRTIWA